MTERGILFSGAMVRALLDGTKRQTRRPCKPMNQWVDQECREVRMVDGAPHHFMKGATAPLEKLRCPYGQPGDRLWVRETYQPLWAEGIERESQTDWKTGAGYRVSYPATDGVQEFIDADDNLRSTCKPSIHMPRWASRILLEITSVRVERLQEISREDAIAEGVEPHEVGQFALYGATSEERAVIHREAAVGPYHGLWDSINGAGSWDANPWVWVVEFRRIEP